MIFSVDPTLHAHLSELIEKYDDEGKDISCYLKKLLHEKNIEYADYLHLDTLLTLQKPKTSQPDEVIFIVYHQVVELFFRLIIWELKQITNCSAEPVGPLIFKEKIGRIIRYLEILISSFQVMLKGLDKQQFKKFRYTLFPASGFQSHQYRLIEFYLTDLRNLVSVRHRKELPPDADIAFLYDRLYWKQGMYDPVTGKKSPTLEDFEKRYDHLLLEHARAHRSQNVWRIFERYFAGKEEAEGIGRALRELDELLNVRWQGLHYEVAMKHLTGGSQGESRSTGNTQWRKYLHPRFRKIIFFPSLWREHEIAGWGTTGTGR